MAPVPEPALPESGGELDPHAAGDPTSTANKTWLAREETRSPQRAVNFTDH